MISRLVITLSMFCLSSAYGQSPKWITVPESKARCTQGSRDQGHFAQVRISTFDQGARISLTRLSGVERDAVKKAISAKADARYVGNGPIYLVKGVPNGYLVTGGKEIWPLDCVSYRSNPENLGRENSVFLKYRRKDGSGEGAEKWKYQVLSTETLCGKEGEALREGSQIDFAIQSGPAVLRDGKNLLRGYNAGKDYRSYIGVDTQGRPVVVDSDGFIGSYCLGEYLKEQGIQDLLHRDSSVTDVSYREKDGSITGYPTANRSARAASLLIVTE